MASIVLYRGSRGKGKTLTMVKDALKYQLLGWKILTNLDGTPFEKISSEYILSLDGSSQLFNTVLLIDEIELFFDSREWTRSESKKFGRFLQQIRKRNVPILCTAQFTDLIEKRLRQQIDILVICSFDKVSQKCHNVYVDLTSIESNPLDPSSFVSDYLAFPIFGLYNTHQIIQ